MRCERGATGTGSGLQKGSGRFLLSSRGVEPGNPGGREGLRLEDLVAGAELRARVIHRTGVQGTSGVVTPGGPRRGGKPTTRLRYPAPRVAHS